jgi:phosphate transport system protein
MPSHYEESMQRDIDRLRGKVAEMAALAEGALTAVLRAVVNQDRKAAYTVILRDQRIDELEKEIDRLCLEFIVRQQPVAKHLRFAYIAIKINQEIERIGDYAESIAKQVLKLADIEFELPVARFEEIANLAIPMLRDAARAFLTEDAELARRTMVTEVEVDELKSVINAELFKLAQTGGLPMAALTPLMTIARRFERVTDQAKNMCEEIIYMITGEYSKHAAGDVWRMVFLDNDNSCTSQMAEAIGHSLNRPQFVFASAGLSAGTIDPGTIEFLQRKGLDVSHSGAHALEQVPNFEYAQILVALTPEAKRGFPSPTKAVCLDWSLADPSKVPGSPEEKRAAYERAYRFLHTHISELCDAVLSDSLD